MFCKDLGKAEVNPCQPSLSLQRALLLAPCLSASQDLVLYRPPPCLSRLLKPCRFQLSAVLLLLRLASSMWSIHLHFQIAICSPICCWPYRFHSSSSQQIARILKTCNCFRIILLISYVSQPLRRTRLSETTTLFAKTSVTIKKQNVN